MTGRLLIAGVGNIFLGDDGFGVEVASRLAAAELPGWVHVVDYGIRGMHLAYDLANGYDSMILIDATARGGEPGTVYVIEPDLAGVAAAGPDGNATAADATAGNVTAGNATAGNGEAGNGAAGNALADNPLFNAHGMQPDVVFGMLGMLDAGARQVLVVGCEPASLDYNMGLSEPVAAAVDEAVRVVLDLVASAAASGEEHHLITKEWSYVPRDSG
jgi:hydrogenase maturation protease